MIARFLSLVAALLCAGAVDVQLANADTASAPFTLDYSVTPVGPNYQYNFSLVLDNNDGSWVPGQEFNWLIVGAAVNQPSPFAELDSFFTSIPANSYATSTSGFLNGPTLCFGMSCADPYNGYQPTALGETLNFTGLSSTLIGPDQLDWIVLFRANADFTACGAAECLRTANLMPTPVPNVGAGLPGVLFGAALLTWWRVRRQRAVTR
jgi:hypothetical protein